MTAARSGMILHRDLRRRERALAGLRVWHLDHRLERTWRQARRERDARLLASLRDRIGETVLAATGAASVAGTAAEIIFVDGYHLSLGPCHGPTVAALAGLIADGARSPSSGRRDTRPSGSSTSSQCSTLRRRTCISTPACE